MAIDLSPILNPLIASDVVQGAIFIGGNLVAAYIALLSVLSLLSLIRGTDRYNFEIFFDHVRWVRKQSRNAAFARRHRREQEFREYREWKKSKGLK